MSKGRKFAVAAGVLCAVMVVSGLTAMAVSGYGSQDDPLVTLSYLNETVTPAITEELQRMVDEKAAELLEELRASGAAPGTGSPAAENAGFEVLTLSNGQTVTCEVGAEIMLRVGTAVSAGPDSPRLIDETLGETVASSGAELEKNHMYMVTIVGNGVKATRDNTKILIRGKYSVS